MDDESERLGECRFRFQNITHFPPQHVIMGCLGNENNKRVRDVGGYEEGLFQMGALKTYPEQKGWTSKSILGSAHCRHIFFAATRPARPMGKMLLLNKTFIFSLVNALCGIKIVPVSNPSGRISQIFCFHSPFFAATFPMPRLPASVLSWTVKPGLHHHNTSLQTTQGHKLHKIDRVLPVPTPNVPKRPLNICTSSAVKKQVQLYVKSIQPSL